MVRAIPARLVRAIALFSIVFAMLFGFLLYPFTGERVTLALYLLLCLGGAGAFFLVLLAATFLLGDQDEESGQPVADPVKGLRDFALVLGVIFAMACAVAVFRSGWSASIPTLAIYATGYASIIAVVFALRRRT